MLVDKNATPIDGITICGETFVPASNSSAHAIFYRGDRSCGITFDMGRIHPFLRCAPGIALPPWARDINVWRRLAWFADDDRLLDVEIDESDGEITYLLNDEVVGDDPERSIAESLDFLLGDDFERMALEFVSACDAD
jgi:hypothetical protein